MALMKTMQHFSVLALERQSAPGADKRVWCLKLACEEAYAPGDWFLVQPVNPPRVVEDVLRALSLSGHERVALRRIGEVTAAEALGRHLEITQLDPALLNRLKRTFGIGEWADRAEMAAWAARRNLLDLLCDYPEARALGLELLPQLSVLAPRFYSIASSWRATPGQVHLLFREVVHQVCDREHPGAATWTLAHLEPGDRVLGRIQANPHFRLPEDGNTPIIMIGAGVGLAPFMGFVADRVATGARSGNWLFFGETRREKTFLCRERLEHWVDDGALRLTTAFSRDQAEKIYVQHRLAEHAGEVRAWIGEGAHVYLCGDKRGMGPAVLDTLRQLLGDAGFDALKAEGRLQTDLF